MKNQKAKEGQAIDKHEISALCDALSISISSPSRPPKRHLIFLVSFAEGQVQNTEPR